MLLLSCFPQVPGGVWQLIGWQHKGSLENDFKQEPNRSRCMEKLLQNKNGLPVVNFIWERESVGFCGFSNVTKYGFSAMLALFYCLNCVLCQKVDLFSVTDNPQM